MDITTYCVYVDDARQRWVGTRPAATLAPNRGTSVSAAGIVAVADDAGSALREVLG